MTFADSIFVELRFWALIAVSLVLPLCLYALLHKRRAISPATVLLLGLTLVCIAASDVGLLHSIQNGVERTPSKIDDFFASEMAIGFYLVPALFGGIGIDLISSVLRTHLQAAEDRYKSSMPASMVESMSGTRAQGLREALDVLMVRGKLVQLPHFCQDDFVLEHLGERFDVGALRARLQRMHADAAELTVRYDEASWTESADKVAVRLWITASRGRLAVVETEVFLIARFEGAKLKHVSAMRRDDA